LRLTTTGNIGSNALAQQWEEALRPMIIRHSDPRCGVWLELIAENPPRLSIRLDVAYDTTDPTKEMRPLHVSTVELTYFPGNRLARAFIAAAWTGYLMHEALELVTVGDLVSRPIDPHANEAQDKCIRDGIPTTLTPESLRTSLLVVMRPELVEAELGRG
jgi:hypothetical protein